MLRFLGYFRVSLGELLLLVTYVAVVLGIHVALNERDEQWRNWLYVALQCGWLAALLGATVVSQAIPRRRRSLQAFVATALLFYLFVQTEFYTSVMPGLLEALWERTQSLQNLTPKVFVEFTKLELSLLVGLVCAWFTRSLQNAVRASRKARQA